MAGPLIIIGGGIGGLTLALSLHEVGIPCRVYENAPQFKRLGVGINLLPHAMRELSRLGLQDALAARAVGLARHAGALTVLPIALTYRAGVHVHAGEFAAASDLIEEADVITGATGNAPLSYTSLVLTAWRGEEAPALALIEAGTALGNLRS